MSSNKETIWSDMKSKVDAVSRTMTNVFTVLPPVDRLFDVLIEKKESLKDGSTLVPGDSIINQALYQFLEDYGQLRKQLLDQLNGIGESVAVACSFEVATVPEANENKFMIRANHFVEEPDVSNFLHQSSGSEGSVFSPPLLNWPPPELIIPGEPVLINKRYYCSFGGCGANFAQATPARAHMRRVHTNNPIKMFYCRKAKCNYSTDRKFSFDRHQKKHTKSRPFECTHPGCGKSFKTASTLRGHQYTHSSGQSWICALAGCGRKFKSPNSLGNHQTRNHRGDLLANMFRVGKEQKQPEQIEVKVDLDPDFDSDIEMGVEVEI